MEDVLVINWIIITGNERSFCERDNQNDDSIDENNEFVSITYVLKLKIKNKN